ncbi:ribonuclease toxin immunity protein CdiI [Psychrobacter vallis]|uniref:ribonuclease toxin immunity protein CdiI n=1 Tax=Psychrobacter vallis TaxID=248451 RepID=UPI001918D913|nr:ribonuclease toxin immunity protein CdiI [Psychrobacter vallis]
MSTHNSKLHYCPKEPENYYYFYNLQEIHENKPSGVIKECFSTLYKSSVFLESIYDVLVNYDNAGVEGCYWYYPDPNSPYVDDVFEGVCFEIGFNDPDMKVYVSEEVSFDYAKKACQRFLEIHPEYNEFLTNIIENWQPLNP